MCRVIEFSRLFSLPRLAAFAVLLFSLNGCAAFKSLQVNTWFTPVQPETALERNRFPVANGDDVVGRLAVVRLEEGDTLPDIARHFGLGINAISAVNPDVDVWVPGDGERVVLPLSFILPDAPRKGIVINLAAMRLFSYKGEGKSMVVSTYPVGIGTEDRPTPRGQARVVRKTARPTWHVPASIAEAHRKKGDILPAAVPPGPENPLGDYALYLSKTGYLIHGTNKAASIGLQATNGCMRLYPENIKNLFSETPVNTPVLIVNQPYLIGQRDGLLYMEVHKPLEGQDDPGPDSIFAKLKTIEMKSGRTLDWKKVKEVQSEARGIPVPIFELGKVSETDAASIMEVEHPDRLYGKPEVPELKMDAWYVLAGDTREEIEARRLAAIINHQGPPIPARVISRSSGFRVIAGPFDGVGEAREAVKRLKFDLDIDGVLIEPDRKS